MPLKQPQIFLTHCLIDLKAVRLNIKQLKKLILTNYQFSLPTRPKPRNPPELLSVIKADAYGHGMIKVAEVLDKEGVGFFGVSDLSEGIALRKSKLKRPILLFETALLENIDLFITYNLMPTVCSLNFAKQLNQQAGKKKKYVDIHIKVDTGMGRLGVFHKNAREFILKVSKLNNLRIVGLMTHFPAADTDKSFTQKQLIFFYDIVTYFDKQGLIIPYIHAANSMGLAGYKTHVLNLARPGLMMYGLYPHKSLHKKIKLKPAMSIKSKVIFVKDVDRGQSISYGRTFFTKSDMRIATIPIGYNDGYSRSYSNKSDVLIQGTRCAIVGVVTMDQIMVDVTHLKSVHPGAVVVILGKQGKEEITADELASHAGTINYEIVCNLGNRLPRLYK
ncbi:MAG: alanine racemase [Lysobacterales bacterium]|jgi:alanine racemase